MPTPVRVESIVTNILDHGDGVYTIRLSVPQRATRFKAGQFLHLTLDEFDPTEGYWPASRVFSIASKPKEEHLEIVYSVKGVYTKRMSEELQVGKTVWIKLPYGDFIVEKYITSDQHVVFIAGGTGISPFVPYFHQVLESGSINPISIYYGIRNQDHFLYKNLLNEIDSLVDIHITEGLFDIPAICNEITNLKGAVCFISGPPVMIQACKKELKEQGFPPESIIIDAWE